MIFLWSVSFEMPNQLSEAWLSSVPPTPVIISSSLCPAMTELILLAGEDQMLVSASEFQPGQLEHPRALVMCSGPVWLSRA